MKFNINEYKGKYAMHCKTEKEAKIFGKYLHSVGRKWQDGDNYVEYTGWGFYRENTIYIFNEGHRGNLGRDRDQYKILEFSDFDWPTFTKSDLKDGMVIEYRNGSREVVFGTRTLSITGWNSLSEVNDDLIEIKYKDPAYDIVKVYEIAKKETVCGLKNIFEDRNLTLLWERKEEPDYKEMTVEEIEKELGYKVKVIADKE